MSLIPFVLLCLLLSVSPCSAQMVAPAEVITNVENTSLLLDRVDRARTHLGIVMGMVEKASKPWLPS